MTASTSIDTRPADRLLRLALRANAAFSGICGITALLAAGALAASLGIADERLLPVQGVSLVGFSGLLAWLSARPSIRPGLALAIVVMDVLWVATTAVPLLLSGWLTPVGTEVMLVIATIVLGFAAIQYAGLRQMRAHTA
jgi:hypothetical protein